MWKAIGIVILLTACAAPAPEPVSDAAAAATPRPPEQEERVPIQPGSGARELQPGVFVEILQQADQSGVGVENDQPFTMGVTYYRTDGAEFNKAVASTRWSLLSEAERAGLRGMRSGEKRRIWHCNNPDRTNCVVEDILVPSVSERRPN